MTPPPYGAGGASEPPEAQPTHHAKVAAHGAHHLALHEVDDGNEVHVQRTKRGRQVER